MPVEETWSEYSKLVLKELERLNLNYERMHTDIDKRLNQITLTMSEFKGTEKLVAEHKAWIEKVTDVWSTQQMLSAKDEIYKQKNRWTAAMAIFAFIQILMGIALSLVGKFK